MKKIIIIIISLALLTNTLQLYDGNSTWTYIYYASYVLIPVISLFIFKEIKINLLLTVSVFLFCMSMFMSGMVNGSIRLILNSLLFMLFFISYTVIIPSIFKNNTSQIIDISLLFTHVPLLIVPLFTTGIDRIPYMGIFLNSNVLGIIATTLYTVLIARFTNYLELKFTKQNSLKQKKIILDLLLIMFLVTLIVLSNSRTSFLTLIVVTVLALLILFIRVSKKINITSSLLKILGFILILILLVILINIFIPVFETINTTIISKFIARSDNLLSGRQYSWDFALNESGLFGNGQYVFVDIVGLGAHNTFINILGIYGWISVIFFVILIIISIYYAFKFALISDDQMKYSPILMLVTFVLLSMGENIFEHISMVYSFTYLGIISNNRKIIIKKES